MISLTDKMFVVIARSIDLTLDAHPVVDNMRVVDM